MVALKTCKASRVSSCLLTLTKKTQVIPAYSSMLKATRDGNADKMILGVLCVLFWFSS